MTEEGPSSATARAVCIYRELEGELLLLDQLRSRISKLQESLIATYEAFRVPTRLGLLTRRTYPGGGSASVSWGIIFSPTHVRGRMRADATDGVNWVRRLPGDLDQGHLHQYCRDGSWNPVLLSVERRRKLLNRAAMETSLPLRAIRRSLANFARATPFSRPLPPPPHGLSGGHFINIASAFIRLLWAYSIQLAFVESDLISLTNTHNSDPPDPRLRLVLRRTPSATSLRSSWRHVFQEVPYSIVTVAILTRLGIPRPKRREITSYELRRRRIVRLLERYGKASTAIRKHAEEGARATTRLIEEAQAITLPDAA